MLIGDAAHVMSPVFGVGINYAIADAVELVNAAVDSLLRGDVPESALAEVQHLRERPTRIIQRMQAAVQERIVKRALDGKEFDLPPIAKLVLRTPLLRDIPARDRRVRCVAGAARGGVTGYSNSSQERRIFLNKINVTVLRVLDFVEDVVRDGLGTMAVAAVTTLSSSRASWICVGRSRGSAPPTQRSNATLKMAMPASAARLAAGVDDAARVQCVRDRRGERSELDQLAFPQAPDVPR